MRPSFVGVDNKRHLVARLSMWTNPWGKVYLRAAPLCTSQEGIVGAVDYFPLYGKESYDEDYCTECASRNPGGAW